MNFLKNHGMTICIVVLVIILLVVLKMQWDASKERDALNNQLIEMKQLQDGIVRNQSQYVSKDDLNKFAKELGLNLDAIRKDLATFDAEIKGISHFLASSRGRKGTDIPSTDTNPRPDDPSNPLPTCPDGSVCPDPYGYLSNSQTLGLSEPFNNVEVPIGDVTFEAWKEKPWSVNILPRDYHVNTVLGQDEDGRHYVYNQMKIKTDGKEYEIPIEQAEFEEVYPESEFRFNPKLHLGVDVGATVTDIGPEVIPNLQVSLFSYGKTKTNVDTEWSFVGVGVGFGTQDKTFNVVVTPVNYNVGQHIPLVESLHVGPTISLGHQGDVFVGGGIRVGL